MLYDIRHYLQRHGPASVADLADDFACDLDDLGAILGVLEHHGFIRQATGGHTPCAGKCAGCQASEIIYEWACPD